MIAVYSPSARPRIPWRVPDQTPPDSVAEAVLAGGED
jgi:hypothetical protein